MTETDAQPAEFVHLRVHSAYSLSEGALRIKQIVGLCQDHAMPAVAVTDTGNLFGALEFASEAAKGGVQPIIGVRLRLAWPEEATERDPPRDPIQLLVQTEAGYRRLLRLVSRSYLETDPGEPPHIRIDWLEEDGIEGLIALTGGAGGPLARPLRDGNAGKARDRLDRLAALFGDRLYVEIERHETAAELAVEEGLIALAYDADLPLVATNACYFADAGMYEAHDALLCIAQGVVVDKAERRRETPEHRFKSAEEMRALFADLPEAVANTLAIARRCSFLLEPIKPILPPFPTVGGRTEAEELRAQARDGLRARLDIEVDLQEIGANDRENWENQYWERLDRELDIIEQMGFPGYFLIVADFIQWTKGQDIPVGPGRGSGAGSVVAWALTITDLDPIRWGLLFERFLNPERVSMPDFDIDFCQDRRDEVIAYVQQRYGRDRVAQIITFGKLQARAVVRDVGRVLAMPFYEVDRLSKMIPNNPANPITLAEAIDGDPQLQALRDREEAVGRLLDIGLKLEGLYRHASTHAAGVVIGDRPLDQLIPLYRDPRSDMPVTQFNMKWVEQAGLVKFDFLGLKTLTVLKETLDLIAAGGGPRIDLSTLGLDDPKAYALMSAGRTVGVFQLESAGMRDTLKKLKPDRFEDIIAIVSLYRPGPMDNIPSYIARKAGKEKPDYLHPLLEPVLTETFGIMIYQEQVMQAAQLLAGYSLGAADLLRRAMGKKIKEAMDAERAKFLAGATERGVDAEQAGLIFDQMAKFAGYGFNKSHAAAYALIAYHTAWLKANWPVEFLAGSMTLDLGNTDKLDVFRQELAALEIPLLPPDVNRSAARFSVELMPDGRKAIRYALGAIKGVGEMAMEALVAERDANGPFRDLFDFARRLDPRHMNKKQVERLACAGALDGLQPNRRLIHDQADTLMRYAQAVAEERMSGQSNLFGGPASADLPPPRLEALEDWDKLTRLQHEHDAIGFYLTAHPLDDRAEALKRLGAISWREMAGRLARGSGGGVWMAGVVADVARKISGDGRRFAFAKLSDPTGVFELRVYQENLAALEGVLEEGAALLVRVDGQLRDDRVNLILQGAERLDDAIARSAQGLVVFIDKPGAAGPVQEALSREGRGRGRVTLVIKPDAQREVEVELAGRWSVTGRCKAAIKSIAGVAEVELV